ncbi:MAG: hypothetical protein C0592_14135 [Marinilabiliales bacterium]|nr:MAG: hypothetical protein C0592_14135 [Marinilabiliales bacterium]
MSKKTEESNLKKAHNKNAPYWAAAIVIFGISGLSSIWFDLGQFWKGYILDMAGPAWNYILFRGLFTSWTNNKWTRFFTPLRTVILFILVCFGIETLQFFEVYDSTFDPFDLLAYISILVPIYLIDNQIIKKAKDFRNQDSQ